MAIGTIISISFGGAEVGTVACSIIHYLDLAMFILFGLVSVVIIAFATTRGQ